MVIDSLILGAYDVVHCCAWMAGSLVRTFDLGREGYLPELKSDTGRRLVQEAKYIRAEAWKQREKTSKTPVGFY